MVAEIDIPVGPGIYLAHDRVDTNAVLRCKRGAVARSVSPLGMRVRLDALIADVLAVRRKGSGHWRQTLRRVEEIKTALASDISLKEGTARAADCSRYALWKASSETRRIFWLSLLDRGYKRGSFIGVTKPLGKKR